MTFTRSTVELSLCYEAYVLNIWFVTIWFCFIIKINEKVIQVFFQNYGIFFEYFIVCDNNSITMCCWKKMRIYEGEIKIFHHWKKVIIFYLFWECPPCFCRYTGHMWHTVTYTWHRCLGQSQWSRSQQHPRRSGRWGVQWWTWTGPLYPDWGVWSDSRWWSWGPRWENRTLRLVGSPLVTLAGRGSRHASWLFFQWFQFSA